MAENNEDQPIDEIPVASSITGAKILGVSNAGETKLFNISDIKGDGKGLALAGTNPVSPILSQYYFATPGVTYTYFLDAEGDPITIPTSVSGDPVVTAYLVYNGTNWEGKAYATEIELVDYVQKDNSPTGYYGPYADIAAANAAIIGSDRIGKIVGIETENGIVDYTWRFGVTNSDLITTDTETLSDDYKVVDSSGNVVFKIAENGLVSLFNFDNPTLNRIKAKTRKKIYGKKIAALGNSIWTDTGASGILEKDTFLGILNTEHNCRIHRNAVSSSTMTYQTGGAVSYSDDSRCKTLDLNGDTDIIFIGDPVNDYLQGMPFGAEGSTDRTNFRGALDYIYKSIMTLSPNAKLYQFTPAHNQFYNLAIPEYYAAGNVYMHQYVDILISMARRFGITLIDVMAESGITQYNIGALSTGDAYRTHYKEVGHRMVANLIINRTEETL